MKKELKDKIREICTYHGKDGTSGYLLDEDRFKKIIALIDQKLDYHNYLLQRFNDYETPIQMSAEQVRKLLEEFKEDYEK